MHRLLLPLLFVLTLPAPSPSQDLDKPPQDVDDALRARIKQFYDFHVANKYRQAEQLVAEESKDDFYVLSKPELKNFKIDKIEYTNGFTNAKAVIVGAMPVLLPMAGGKIMDMPFASFWKLENGTWYWYYNKTAALHTPFGDLKPPSESKPGSAPPPPANAPAPPDPAQMMAMLQSALKIDRTRVDLASGKPQTIKVTNTLPGPASLSVECPNAPLARTGITATFDKKDLKGNETAVLTLSVDPKTRSGLIPLIIVVSQTNQVLNFTVNVAQ